MSEALRAIALACPIDGTALRVEGASLRCERGHGYDISRHGHVNLLPVQWKPSRDPGDSAAMVRARRAVLDSGLFDPVADAVAECVGEAVRVAAAERDAPAPLLVDAGCGEGFYTRRFAERLAPSGARLLGTDISKHAVLAAARRHSDIGWAVANNTRLPLPHGAADVVTSLFGFATWTPWAALQSGGQRIVTVDPGPAHLIELREAIYAEVRVHEAPSDEVAIGAGYARVGERRVTRVRDGVGAETLAGVLAMTPHGHRAERRAEAVVVAMGGAGLTLDVVVREYRRAG